MTFTLATLKVGRNRIAAIHRDNPFWPVGNSAESVALKTAPGGLFEYLQVWDKAWPQLKRIADKIQRGAVQNNLAIADLKARLDKPVMLPRKAFCIGASDTGSEALPTDAWTGRTGFVHRAVMQDLPDLSDHQVWLGVVFW